MSCERTRRVHTPQLSVGQQDTRAGGKQAEGASITPGAPESQWYTSGNAMNDLMGHVSTGPHAFKYSTVPGRSPVSEMRPAPMMPACGHCLGTGMKNAVLLGCARQLPHKSAQQA